jgi:two-component system chemotaxis response regulator CheY
MAIENNQGAGKRSGTPRRRLMIVDDSNIVRRQIERAAANERLDIVGTAADGLEALTMFEKLKPEVVTMNLTMPKMSGFECMERMLKARPDTLILVISALADETTAIEAINKGANGFLSKPFTESELDEAFDKMLRKLDA